MKHLKLPVIATMLVFAVACGSSDEKKEAAGEESTEETAEAEKSDKPGELPEGWTSYEKDNYSIQYPKDWEFNTSGSTKFMMLSPMESETDMFRENINMVTESLKGKNVDLDTYAELSTKQLPSYLPDIKITTNEKVKENGRSHYKLVYTASQSGVQLKLEQWFWVVDETAYVLTFSSTAEAFDSFADMGHKIMDTFRIN